MSWIVKRRKWGSNWA